MSGVVSGAHMYRALYIHRLAPSNMMLPARPSQTLRRRAAVAKKQTKEMTSSIHCGMVERRE